MNFFFKEIQKSFDLLDQTKTKQSSFMTALEFMLKIANRSDYRTETYTIAADKNGDIVIVMKTKKATLTIIAHDDGISWSGTGPKKEDQIDMINTRSCSFIDEVFAWIQRNSK